MAQDPELARRERTLREGARVAFCVSTFHAELTEAMLASARRELMASGAREEDMPVSYAPGSFELPLLARRYARQDKVDAVICLGVVLKGETTHDEYVARGAAEGITRAMMETDKPVLLGVLTCQTLEQARARALPPEQGGVQDKGRELARAVIDVLGALDEIDARDSRSERVGFRVPATPGAPEVRP